MDRTHAFRRARGVCAGLGVLGREWGYSMFQLMQIVRLGLHVMRVIVRGQKKIKALARAAANFVVSATENPGGGVQQHFKGFKELEIPREYGVPPTGRVVDTRTALERNDEGRSLHQTQISTGFTTDLHRNYPRFTQDLHPNIKHTVCRTEQNENTHD